LQELSQQKNLKWASSLVSDLNRTRFPSAMRPVLTGMEKVEIVFNRISERDDELLDQERR